MMEAAMRHKSSATVPKKEMNRMAGMLVTCPYDDGAQHVGVSKNRTQYGLNGINYM
jgi:uncharacterized protein YijF (DUF1287 family)